MKTLTSHKDTAGCHPWDGQSVGGGSPSSMPEKWLGPRRWCSLGFLYGEQRSIGGVHKLMSKVGNEAASLPIGNSCRTSAATTDPSLFVPSLRRIGRLVWPQAEDELSWWKRRTGSWGDSGRVSPEERWGCSVSTAGSEPGRELEELSLEQGCRSNRRKGSADLGSTSW